MTDLLAAHQLHLRPRLNGVSLTLRPGHTLGLLGVNGAGKSTLLAILAGAMGCDNGQVLIEGEPLERRPALRRRIGWLPQRPPLYPDMTVMENLRFNARLRQRRPQTGELAQWLQRFDLQGLQQRLARQLSGGEAMRLGLACCLAHQPDILLLDEPSAGLDPLAAEQLRALIALQAGHCAVLLASHQPLDIDDLCDAVMLLHQGRVVAEQALDKASPLWQVDFAHPPSDAELLAIDTIEAVTARQDGQLTLRLREAPGPDRSQPLAEQLAGRGWGLHSCRPAGSDWLARFRALDGGMHS